MIDSISSSSVYQYMASSKSSSNNSLSLEQQETIESVLSNYDSSNLSSSDAQEIVNSFEAAGISPSKSLADTMDSLGFDAREVGDLAGVQGPKGGGGMPPPPPPKNDDSELTDLLTELLYSSDDEVSTSTFTNAYNSENSTTFDTILDYTSRVLSLNDDAKNEVESLLEKYSSDDNELSSNEVSNIIKNSLQDILTNENNYKSTMFYA